MGIEIERKFLVDLDILSPLLKDYEYMVISQAYLTTNIDATVRVRVTETENGNSANINVKGRNEGITRNEFEYDIPILDAHEIMNMCNNIILKTRYNIDGWEVDFFAGVNLGLIVAEYEMVSEDEEIILPKWVKEEVSHDPRYYNSSLTNLPYQDW